MEFGSIRHKALRRFAETGVSRGVPGDVDRIRRMVLFLAAASHPDELLVPSNFDAHRLTGIG